MCLWMARRRCTSSTLMPSPAVATLPSVPQQALKRKIQLNPAQIQALMQAQAAAQLQQQQQQQQQMQMQMSMQAQQQQAQQHFRQPQPPPGIQPRPGTANTSSSSTPQQSFSHLPPPPPPNGPIVMPGTPSSMQQQQPPFVSQQAPRPSQTPVSVPGHLQQRMSVPPTGAPSPSHASPASSHAIPGSTKLQSSSLPPAPVSALPQQIQQQQQQQQQQGMPTLPQIPVQPNIQQAPALPVLPKRPARPKKPPLSEAQLKERLEKLAKEGSGLPIQDMFTRTSWVPAITAAPAQGPSRSERPDGARPPSSTSPPSPPKHDPFPEFTRLEARNVQRWMEKDLKSVELGSREKGRMRDELEEMAREMLSEQDWLGPLRDPKSKNPSQTKGLGTFVLRTTKEMQTQLAKGKRKNRPWMDL